MDDWREFYFRFNPGASVLFADDSWRVLCTSRRGIIDFAAVLPISTRHARNCQSERAVQGRAVTAHIHIAETFLWETDSCSFGGVITPTLCSEFLRVTSRPGHQVPWLRFSWFFSVRPLKCRWLRLWLLPSVSFPSHFSLIILAFDGI
jgi:hypothetical protein